MLSRILVTLTLLLTVTTGAEPKPSAAAHQAAPARHARVVDDLEGCRVPPPSPEPVAPASCTDEGRP